jgi:hypothetical protein
MRLDNFLVKISEGKELNSGYVAMKHNTKYAVQLSNFSDLQCDAEVEIDGKVVGVWRVQSKDRIIIERPVHDTGCFTFYKIGTREAKKAELVSSGKLGLISVLFKPEKKIDHSELNLSLEGNSDGGLNLDLSLDEDTDDDFALFLDGDDSNDNLDFFFDLENELEDAVAEDTDGGLDLSLDDDSNNNFDLELSAGGTGLSGKSEQEFHTVQPLDYDKTGFVQINLRLGCEADEPRPLTPVSTPVPPSLL